MANRTVAEQIYESVYTGKSPDFLSTVSSTDKVAAGVPGTTVGNVTVTYTSIANGTTPTVSELLEAIVELNAKVQSLSDRLDAFNITQ